MKAVATRRVGRFWIPEHESDDVWFDWECGFSEVLLSALSRCRGCSFADVGANLGYYSRLAAISGFAAEVVAYEPSPVCLPYLRRNLVELPLARAVQAVVGRESVEAADFYWRMHADGDGRAYDPGPTGDGNLWTRLSLPAVALRDLDTGGRPLVVKVDVEGFEVEVLAGLAGHASLAAVLLEFHASHIRRRGIDVGAFKQALLARFVVAGLLGDEGNTHALLVPR